MENISKVDSTEKIRKSKSKKKKKNKNKQVENATIISEEQGESFSITTTEPSTERPPSQSKQQKKTRPNFFLGFRIREQSIIEKASTLQEEIREKIPDIATCLIKPHTFHVTLMVMYLADEEAIEQTRKILRTHGPEFIREAFPDGPPSFEFQGYEFFGRNDVLHTGPDMESKDVKNLTVLVRLLYDVFKEKGFVTEKLKSPYHPHLTIWKASKDPKRIFYCNKGKKKEEYIQQALLEFMAQKSNPSPLIFGTEQPVTFELLSMTEKDEDGYYKEYATLSFFTSAESPPCPSQISFNTTSHAITTETDIDSTNQRAHVQLCAKAIDVDDENFRPLPQRIRRHQR